MSEFERLVEGPTANADRRMRHLAAAIELYRGDYLEDCPYYGDSSFVEQNRALYRSTLVDVLVELGDLNGARGNAPAARRLLRRAAVIGASEDATATAHHPVSVLTPRLLAPEPSLP